MKFRWTIKELGSSSDDRILRALLAERLSELGAYTPLRNRLQAIYDSIDRRIKAGDSDNEEHVSKAETRRDE